jgi:branched-chain amino acid transport system permease protein
MRTIVNSAGDPRPFLSVAVPIFLLIVLALMPVVLTAYGAQVLTVAFYYVMIGVSWNLLAGYTGQFAFAHMALATAAAYSSAAAVVGFGLPVPVGIGIGTVTAAILGFGLGSVTLRTRGTYFALSTWAFAETLRILLAQNYQITRGDNGLPVPFLYGSVDPVPYYYTFLAAATLMVVFSMWLLRTKLGYRMVAIRDDEEVATALGINAFRWKRVVFTISAALVGASGALYGHTIGLLTPSMAEFSQMAFVVVAVVLGGYRTIWGPVIGALIAQGLAEWLRFSEELRLVLFAVIVIAIVRFYPPGIVGGIRELARRLFEQPSPGLGAAAVPTHRSDPEARS